MKPFSRPDIERLIGELEAYAVEYDTKGQANLVRRTVGALKRYATGRASSLDEAFGIIKRDSRSIDKLDKDRERLLIDAYEMKYLSGGTEYTWADIAYELNSEALGIKWRRLCTMVQEQKERLKAYFENELPRRQFARDLEKEAESRTSARRRQRFSSPVRVKKK